MNDFDTNQTLYELAKQRDLAQTQLSIATEALADIVAHSNYPCFDAVKVAAGALKAVNDAETK